MYTFGSDANIFFLGALSAIGAKLDMLIDKVNLAGLSTVGLGTPENFRDGGINYPTFTVAAYNTNDFLSHTFISAPL